MAPREGVEPPTNRLTADRSTTELPRNGPTLGRIVNPRRFGLRCQRVLACIIHEQTTTMRKKQQSKGVLGKTFLDVLSSTSVGIFPVGTFISLLLSPLATVLHE